MLGSARYVVKVLGLRDTGFYVMTVFGEEMVQFCFIIYIFFVCVFYFLLRFLSFCFYTFIFVFRNLVSFWF